MSAWKRGDTYYLDFKPDGYPDRIRRSTGQGSKRTARAVEATLNRMGRAGHHELLDRVRDGDLHPMTLHGMVEAGRLDELLRDLDDPLLEPVATQFADDHPDWRTEYGIRNLLEVAPEGARLSWLANPANLRKVLRYYRDEKYAISTEHRDLSSIRQLVRRELGPEVQQRVFAKVKLRPKPEKRVRYLETDEIERVREAAGDWWLVFGTYLATGMRRGELPPRQRRDFDAERGTLTVESGKTSRSRRTLPLGGEILAMLRGWVVDRELASADPLFPGVTYDNVWTAWEQIRENAKCPDATIHGLRHTYAVHMARAGMPLVELKRRLGHSRIETTMKYAEYAPEHRSPHYDRGLRAMGISSEDPALHPHSAEGEGGDVLPFPDQQAG